MGLGFPTRPSRASFGATRKNLGARGNPETTVDAGEYNLLFWQAAGLSLLTAVAEVLMVSGATTSALGLTHAFEAWDPENISLEPTLARTSAGLYTITYPTTAPNESGESVAINFRAASASLHLTGAWGFVQAKRTAANVITVSLATSAGVATDTIGGNPVSILVLAR